MAEKESVDPKSGETTLVRRGRVASVDLYEVKEDELLSLEKGGAGDLFLNLAIAFGSICFSAFITVRTAEIKTQDAKLVIYFAMVITGLFTPVFLLLWWRARISVKSTIKGIRARLDPYMVPASLPPRAHQSESEIEPQ